MINVLKAVVAKYINNVIEEESEAAKKAKSLGLVYTGFGKWKTKGGITVAKTVDGSLKKISGTGYTYKSGKAGEVVKKAEKKVKKDTIKKKSVLGKNLANKYKMFGSNPALGTLIKKHGEAKGKAVKKLLVKAKKDALKAKEKAQLAKLKKAEKGSKKTTIVKKQIGKKPAKKAKKNAVDNWAETKKSWSFDQYKKQYGDDALKIWKQDYGGKTPAPTISAKDTSKPKKKEPKIKIPAIKVPSKITTTGKKNKSQLDTVIAEFRDKKKKKKSGGSDELSADDTYEMDDDREDIAEFIRKGNKSSAYDPSNEPFVKKMMKKYSKLLGIKLIDVSDLYTTLGEKIDEILDEFDDDDNYEQDQAWSVAVGGMNNKISGPLKAKIKKMELQASKTRIGRLIGDFTGSGHDDMSSGHLAKMVIAAKKNGKVTPKDMQDDYRLKRTAKECEQDKDYLEDEDREACENLTADVDLEHLHNLQIIRSHYQAAIVDAGLVDEKGYITLYRGVGDTPKGGKTDPEDKRFKKFNYKGSAVDSWTYDPRVCTDFGSDIITAKIKLEDVVAAPGLSQSNFLANTGQSENEIIVDTRNVKNCTYANIDANDVSGIDFVERGYGK